MKVENKDTYSDKYCEIIHTSLIRLYYFLNKVIFGKSFICSIEILVREVGIGRNNKNGFIKKKNVWVETATILGAYIMVYDTYWKVYFNIRHFKW